MDILYLFDLLIATLYIIFIVFISPFLVRFLKLFTPDWVLQIAPVFVIILISSGSITHFGYNGFSNTPFFQFMWVFSISLILLLALLFIAKTVWKEHYEKLTLKLVDIKERIHTKLHSIIQEIKLIIQSALKKIGHIISHK
ncbi:hypothetical protein ACXYMX_13510 [Sporosarcina sp. CAU 1771]